MEQSLDSGCESDEKPVTVHVAQKPLNDNAEPIVKCSPSDGKSFQAERNGDVSSKNSAFGTKAITYAKKRCAIMLQLLSIYRQFNSCMHSSTR